MNNGKQLIGMAEAARIANVSRQTISSWVKNKWVTIIRRGRPEGYNGQPIALLDPDQVLAVARERGTIDGGTEVQSV